jgi:hypothetical protein
MDWLEIDKYLSFNSVCAQIFRAIILVIRDSGLEEITMANTENVRLSDRVRELARRKYVAPAISSGNVRFAVAVRDVMHDLAAQGFPPGNTPQVCSALRKKSFLQEQGIEIESVDGPPSKMSTTVVYHYRVAKPQMSPSTSPEQAMESTEPATESSEARTERLVSGLRGLLKEEMAKYGGAEGFIRWVRGYDEEDAA